MITSTTYEDPIQELETELENNPGLCDLVLKSLNQAKAQAEEHLNRDLFKALEWPENIKGYISYLKKFSEYIPQQSSERAWAKPDSNERHGQQEVYDRLCHFYWLIDQKISQNDNKIVENNEWFSKWLVRYANEWGSFLDTTKSFNQKVLNSFINNSPKYRVKDSMIDGNQPNSPSGWLTFNQFFARELNPGLRPITSPTDNSVVTSPADCTYHQSFTIGADSGIPQINIKKTHKYANIEDLLQGSPNAGAFAGGTFIHYFLAPYSYHRFHLPVSGLLRECRAVSGLVYLEVEIDKQQGQFSAPDSSGGQNGQIGGYEFTQARGIVTIDTSGSEFGDIGLVAVIPVGMAQVSSVKMTASVGKKMSKGDEFGYFLFGGSDIIVLFQQGANPQIDKSSHYRHYGNKIATCNKR